MDFFFVFFFVFFFWSVAIASKSEKSLIDFSAHRRLHTINIEPNAAVRSEESSMDRLHWNDEKSPTILFILFYYSFQSLLCGYRFIHIFLLCWRPRQVDLTFLSLTLLSSSSQIWNDLTAVLLAACLLFWLFIYFLNFLFLSGICFLLSCKSSFSLGLCLKGLWCTAVVLHIFVMVTFFW